MCGLLEAVPLSEIACFRDGSRREISRGTKNRFGEETLLKSLKIDGASFLCLIDSSSSRRVPGHLELGVT
jgi:hypothetical protein